MRRTAAFAAMILATGCANSKQGSAGPTPTPSPSMIVQPVITISGTTEIERGECVSFRIQTSNFTVPPTASVRFGSYELARSVFLVLDSDTVEVGFPCFYTGLDLALGPLDVAVIAGTESLTGTGVFTVGETTRVDLGAAPTDSIAAPDADANALGVLYDFDVYDWSAPAAGLYLSEAIVATNAVASFRPYQFVTAGGTSAWNGSEAVMIPASAGALTTEIADDTVAGGPSGFTYHMKMTPLGTPVTLDAADTCDALASVTTAGLFTVDLAAASPDYNPAGSAACLDRHSPLPPVAGEGVNALGRDRALKLVVPAGATLSAVGRGATTDVVLYLVADSGTPCAPVSSCLAASDVFGPGDSETLLWKNSSASDQAAWLIVDDFGTNSVAGGVTLLLRYSP